MAARLWSFAMKTGRVRTPLVLACITLAWIAIAFCWGVVRELRATTADLERRIEEVEARPRAVVTVNDAGQLEVRTDGNSDDTRSDGDCAEGRDLDGKR